MKRAVTTRASCARPGLLAEWAAGLVLGLAVIQFGCAERTMSITHSSAVNNRAVVQAAFEHWRTSSGGPFELLAPDAEWTIVGSSPKSKTYASREAFLDEIIRPFNARLAKPLVPAVQGLYADGDTVIVYFDAEALAKDGQPYRNTYTWYLQMREGKIIRAVAFFDTRRFDEFWNRVAPSP